MTASLLDGKLVANNIRENLTSAVTERAALGHRPPGLAVVYIGNDPASSIYVNHKRKACAELGFHSYAYDMPSTTSSKELLSLIDSLNKNKAIDGILVQLPLPSHIDETAVIEQIDPQKDVDGFHPYNFGRLAQGNPSLRPCTPYGIIQLLTYYDISLKAKSAVVVGASNIVGRPMALELLLAKATVTICHSNTRSLEEHIRCADIIVVATGVYDVVKTDWLQENQIIVDVGMHRREDGSVHGDMNFKEASNKVAWMTPVPGGVGPMTIVTLLQNTLLAANRLGSRPT
jgi:methylenetetrahydrofolate dehydrogenase (NADP+)/methenyltetrahydrofolate cyclohydrolase